MCKPVKHCPEVQEVPKDNIVLFACLLTVKFIHLPPICSTKGTWNMHLPHRTEPYGCSFFFFSYQATNESCTLKKTIHLLQSLPHIHSPAAFNSDWGNCQPFPGRACTNKNKFNVSFFRCRILHLTALKQFSCSPQMGKGRLCVRQNYTTNAVESNILVYCHLWWPIKSRNLFFSLSQCQVMGLSRNIYENQGFLYFFLLQLKYISPLLPQCFSQT